jgi:hypothetical protein
MEKPSEEKSFFSHFSFITSISTYEQKNPWLYWTWFYFLFVIAAIVVTFFYVWIGYPFLGFSDTNVNSARLLLSSIIQAEAAIIAIVISLTLVAIQLVSSSYSPRVARIFSSGNQMYIILLFYVTSIAYCAIILQILRGDTGPIGRVFEYLVSFSLWFSLFLMIALVPYIRTVLRQVQPEMIISWECQRISKDTIISASPQSNSLDLIFDILHQSIMKYDTGTVKHQLPQISRAVINVLSEPLTDDEIMQITQDYSQRLTACAQQSIQLDDLESSRIILGNLKDLAVCIITLRKDDAAKQVFDSVHILVKASADKRSWNTLTNILGVLQECGKSAVDNNLELTTERICVCLKQVIQDSIGFINPDDDFGPFYRLAERSIDIIAAFGYFTITDNRPAINDTIILYLENIGKDCWNKEHAQFVHTVADKILDLWLFAVENKVGSIRLPMAAYDAFHSRKRWLERYKFESDIYEHKIMRIGLHASLHGMNNSVDAAVKLLAFFRSFDITSYNENLDRFFEELKDEKERAAYQEIFARSAESAQQDDPGKM